MIVVNDGSTSGISEAEIKKIKDAIFFFKYIHYSENKGKGYALREGVKESDADIIIYTDVDFPYTLDSFLMIWKSLSMGKSDIAAGILNNEYYKQVPAGRRFISRLLRTLTSGFLRTRISDTQRGLKGFNTKGKNLFQQTKINRYLFDLEFIYLASQKKSNVVLNAVEVELNKHVKFSKMKPGVLLKEGFNFMRIFLRSLFRA